MHPLFSSYSDNYVQFSKLYTFTRYLVHAIKIRTFCECSFNNHFKLQCNGQEHYHFPILVLPPFLNANAPSKLILANYGAAPR